MKNNKKLLIVLIIVAAAAVAALLIVTNSNAPEEVDYTAFLEEMEAGKVETVNYEPGAATFTYALEGDEETLYKAQNPKTETFKESLLLAGVDVVEKEGFNFMSLISFLPNIVILCFLVWILLKQFKGPSELTSVVEKPDISFESVAGNEEIKKDLRLIADLIKNKKDYAGLGVTLPKGILLQGDPGNGKTLIARAFAGETGVNFIAANAGSFASSFAGAGASRVRTLFDTAHENKPCIVFIDEIDGIGSSRSSSATDLARDSKQTLNAILTEMDGFESMGDIIVIGATNRVEDLDEALIRPGRFDRHFTINYPNMETREELMRIYSKGRNLEPDVDYNQLAKESYGMSCAAIETTIKESAFIAVRNKRDRISMEDIRNAMIELSIKGHLKDENKTENRERTIVSYHEAGHAVVAYLLTDQTINRISIAPTTSNVGGFTLIAPEKDETLPSVNMMTGMVKMLYAGRAAEYVKAGKIIGEVTVGADNDIKRATGIINKLIVAGSDVPLSFEAFGEAGEEILLEQSRGIAQKLWQETVSLIEEKWNVVEALALELFDRETLTGEEAEAIIKNG